MPQSKFTQYYKDAMKKMLNYLNEKQHLAIRVEEMTKNSVILTIGVSDGRDFILEFGTVECQNGQRVDVKCDNIFIDLTKLIHMEYNTVDVWKTEEEPSLNLLEAYYNK